MLAFLYCFNLKLKVDTVVCHIYFYSKCHVKSKFTSKFIQLATNLFPLEVLQKCQHCQLCVLREKSNGKIGHVWYLHQERVKWVRKCDQRRKGLMAYEFGLFHLKIKTI